MSGPIRSLRQVFLVLALLILGVEAYAQTAPGPWFVTYQFVAPQSIGDKGRSEVALFQVRNLTAGPVKDVVLVALPESAVQLGTQNSVQLGDLDTGGFKTIQVRLTDPTGATQDRCLFALKYTTAAGRQTVKVLALEVKAVTP